MLSENDLDYYVAKAVGAKVISEKPYEEISSDACSKAQELMSKTKVIIDVGFGIGSVNKRNTELVRYALGNGYSVYTLRSKKEAMTIYGDIASRFLYCQSLSQLIENIKGVLLT